MLSNSTTDITINDMYMDGSVNWLFMAAKQKKKHKRWKFMVCEATISRSNTYRQ